MHLKKLHFILFFFPILLLSSEETPVLFPENRDEIALYFEEAKKNVYRKIERITSIANSLKTNENILRPWNQLSSDLLSNFSVLMYPPLKHYPCKNSALLAAKFLQIFLYQTIVSNKDLIDSLLSYAHKAIEKNNSNPYEIYQIDALLKSTKNIAHILTEESQNKLNDLKKIISKYEKTPFEMREGLIPSKLETEKEVTILSLNTCFLPNDLSYVYAGIRPWKKRVDAVADIVVSSQADVICLQEVFTEDASFALYQKLKEHYAHFYLSIAPRTLGFSLDLIGFPSGLFIASKYPIEKPCFTSFSFSDFPINHGFFDFILKNEKGAFAHIYTTHLRPLSEFAHIRLRQLEEILVKMEDASLKSKNVPFILCGDLNIPQGSGELAEILLQSHFYNDYNKENLPVTEENSTYTDSFFNSFLSKFEEKRGTTFEILDYVLLLKSSPFTIETSRISTYVLENPDRPPTDHHALLTKLKLCY